MLEQVLGPIWARRYAVTATAPPSWRRPYTRILGFGDLAVLLVMLGIGRAARFVLASGARADALFSPYDVLGVVMAIVSSLTVIAFRTRSPRVIAQAPRSTAASSAPLGQHSRWWPCRPWRSSSTPPASTWRYPGQTHRRLLVRPGITGM